MGLFRMDTTPDRGPVGACQSSGPWLKSTPGSQQILGFREERDPRRFICVPSAYSPDTLPTQP